MFKSKSLRVSIPETRRDFYLYQPSAGDDWHVRFTPPGWMREKLGLRQRRIERSTGLKLLPPAREQAKRILRSFWGGDGSEAEQARLRSEMSSIGELIGRYLEKASQRSATKRNNVGALRLMLRAVHGGEVDDLSCAVLSGELVREFEAARLTSAAPNELRGVKRSVVSYCKQARSVVSRRQLKFYDGLRLPDFAGFRSEYVEAPERSMPRPMEMNALAAMEAASARLAVDDAPVYVAYLMMSRWGLRNIEAAAARAHWVVEDRIGIIDRPEEDFFPKGAEGWVPVDGAVLARVLSFQHLCTDGFLVPGRTATERHEVVYRRLSRWVSTWIKDRTKTSYELRRYAGSRILDMNGGDIFEVRDFLRHRDVQTTQNWYAYRLKNRKMHTIGMDDLLPSEGAA